MKLKKEKWEQVTIGDIASIQYGSSQKMQIGEEGFKTFRMNEIANGLAFDNGEMKKTLLCEEDFQSYRLEKGDILFNRTNSYELVGRTGIFNLDGDYMFASYLLRLKINPDKADSFFVTHLMTSQLFQKQLKTVATKAVGQANINPTNLKKQILPLPPLSEQKQIAALFQSIETAMEQVDRQEKNLKAVRKSLINKLTKQKPRFGNLLTKLNCKEYSIGEIAVEVPDRTDNPQKSGIEKFIGLEDFESGELTIQKFSSTEKLVSAMKLCKQGDVLFARRNAYLKRASLTDFDAVCSGDVIVMRANEKIILPKFFILIMNTDEFWEFAISNAAGTMSKRVKWRDLATYSFELPDLKIQAKILEVFNQLETTLSQLIQQKATLKLLKQKLLNEILG